MNRITKSKRVYRLVLIALVVTILFWMTSCAELGSDKQQKESKIVVVSDIHFTGDSDTFNYVGSFKEANDYSGTGKQVEFLPQLLDSFVSEMKELHPDVILVTGDNTFSGARESHLALTERFRSLLDEGITVLTIPGNHDINSNSLIFPQGEPVEGQIIGPEDFSDIYLDFGYGGAAVRDPSSLSYVFQGDGVRFFMIDTCFAYGSNLGRVGESTLSWLEEELQKCNAAGDMPLVAGHHNALVHSPLFPFGYTVDDGEAFCQLMRENGVDFYLSGHLHPQSIVNEGDFYDIATECFAIYPHRYGLITIKGNEWNYAAQETKAFEGYNDRGLTTFLESAKKQGEEAFKDATDDPDMIEKLSDYFANANVGYFMGTPIPSPEGEVAEIIQQGEGRLFNYLKEIAGKEDSLSAPN